MKPHEHQPPILPSVRSFSFLDDQRCFETNFPLLRPPMSSLFRNPKNRQASCPFWPPEAFLLDLLPTRLAPCCRACSGKCSCTLWPWRGEVIILIPAPRAPRRHVEKGKKKVFESSSFGKEWNMTFDFPDKPILTYLKQKKHEIPCNKYEI